MNYMQSFKHFVGRSPLEVTDFTEDHETAVKGGSHIAYSLAFVYFTKLAFNAGLTTVVFLSMLHFLFSVDGFRVCIEKEFLSRKELTWLSVLPISVGLGLTASLSLVALQTNSVSNYGLMILGSVPLKDIFYSLIRRRPLFKSYASSGSLILLGIGIGLWFSGALSFSGIFWGGLSVGSTALYELWLRIEKDRLDCSEMDLLYYQSPIILVGLLCLVPFFEDLQGIYNMVWFTNRAIGWMLLSMFCPFLVNYSNFQVQKILSPVQMNFVVCGKMICIFWTGYYCFDEQFTILNISGILICFSGLFWHCDIMRKIGHDYQEPQQVVIEEVKGVPPSPSKFDSERGDFGLSMKE
jgi:hypothetical protein